MSSFQAGRLSLAGWEIVFEWKIHPLAKWSKDKFSMIER
jgi:hypothetical protein